MPIHCQTLRMRYRNSSGFTWIELLAVVAVIGILALMAIPGLQESILKRQVKEGLALAAVAERGVQIVYATTGEMPANNAAAGVPEAAKIIGNTVKEVTVEMGGAVTLTYGNNAAKGLQDKHLTLRPAVVAGETRVPIAWVCSKAGVPNGMQATGTDRTDIQSSWLPVECR